jgi:hypothetical protein
MKPLRISQLFSEPDLNLPKHREPPTMLTMRSDSKTPRHFQHLSTFTSPDRLRRIYPMRGGAFDDRYARIIEDPSQAGNHVLHFWLRNATIPASNVPHHKGRVQHNFGWNGHSEGDVLVELYSRQRIRLHPDFGMMMEYNGTDDWWLEPMIHELWMEGGGKSSRIGIYVIEANPGMLQLAASLSYKNTGEKTWRPGWETLGSVEIPIDEWFTMEVGWRMGDEQTGRFILTIQTSDDSAPKTAIDVSDWTYNPESRRPIPLSKWNPQKLYASDNIVHFIRDNGGVLQIYFDDFEFADSLPEGWE